MQIKILTIVITLSAALLLGSCSKEDDNNPPTKTKTEFITSSSWKFESASASGIGDVSNAPQLACFKDNIITFSSSTAGNIDEGANICAPSTAGAFTWSFQSSETVVRLSAPLFPGGSTDFTIVSLNETNLVLSQAMNIPPIGATTVQVTFKH